MWRTIFLIFFVATSAYAAASWYPTEAGFWNPAECSTRFPTICPPGSISDKLDEFPYWDRIMVSATSIAPKFLHGKIYNGKLLMSHCQHCPSAGEAIGSEWCMYYGEHKGKCYDVASKVQIDPINDDWLLTLDEQPGGDAIPDIPLVRVLSPSEFNEIVEGSLLLAISMGRYTQHPTLGWFKECAPTAAKGNPWTGTDGVDCDSGVDPNCCDATGENCSVDSCCTTNRLVAGIDPFEGPQNASQSCDSVGNSVVAIAEAGGAASLSRVCQGGEGTLTTCESNGLTLLASTWIHYTSLDSTNYEALSARIHSWTIKKWFNYSAPDKMWGFTGFTNGGWAVGKADPWAYTLETVEGEHSNDQCFSFRDEAGIIHPNNIEHGPPNSPIKMYHVCGASPYGQTASAYYVQRQSASGGDSGSPTFIYHKGLWWFIEGGPAGYQIQVGEQRWWNFYQRAVRGISGGSNF